jgi:hypothetical protein
MTEDQLSPEEQEIVRQIQSTSKPKLDATVRDAIRQRMVTEFRAVTVSEPPHPRPLRLRLTLQWAATLVAVMLIAVIGLLVIQSGNQNVSPIVETSTLSLSPDNQVAVVPSATLPLTVSGATAIVTPVPSPVTELAPNIPATTLVATQAVMPSTPTETPEKVVNIEGPVTSIVNNIVTIYGFNIQVAPQHPILQVIDVGDIVRVQGVLDSSGEVIASVVSNIPVVTSVNGSIATVGLDGPVEAINGNTIIVNSIPVELAPNDPLLKTIQVGNFVSVQGNFQTSASTIVLVVMNIAIVNNTVIQSDCWYHADAMGMGHWHCDGMGMGMGEPDGMGMGEPSGMGMGDDAMGMGS